MSNADLYSKFKINTSPDKIQLLRLLPGTPDIAIECELILASLIENPRFEAVSYVWGDATKTLNISISGIKKAATTNLHSFLHSRRDCYNPIILWIDAISINQDDVMEKNQQVSIMKQIYSQADSLSIWLVDNADWRIYRDGKLASVLDILNRSWWERVWVIQVVAFGSGESMERDPAVRCGSHEISWTDLSVAACNMIETDPKYGMPVPQARMIDNLSQEKIAFSASSGSEELTLDRLLKRYRRRKSTDRRDKIYALLGIASSAIAPAETMKPDYSRSVTEVLKQVAVQDVRIRRNLTVLSHAQKRELSSLPSWVPDWTTRLTAPTIIFDLDDHYFDTEYDGMESNCGIWTTRAFLLQATFSEDLESLCVTGLHIDKVISVSELFSEQFTYAEDFESGDKYSYWAKYAANIVALANAQEDYVSYYHEDDPYTDINSRKYAFWTAVFGGRTQVESITETSVGEANYLEWLPRAPEHWTAKMPSWHGIVNDLASKYGDIAERLGAEDFDLRKGPIDFPAFLDVFLHHRESEWSEDWPSVFRTLKYIYNRRAYITQTGYIGVGPTDTGVGDCAVVLFGGDVPFILHPKDGEGEKYGFVGESYVWGLMDGEAVEGLSCDDAQVKTF